jgi:hypothetical protein
MFIFSSGTFAEILHYWRFEENKGFLNDAIGTCTLSGNAQFTVIDTNSVLNKCFYVKGGGTNNHRASFNGVDQRLSCNIVRNRSQPHT